MKRFLEWGLIVVVVGAVLAFGGVQPVVYLLMEIGVFALLLVMLIGQTRRGTIELPIPIAMYAVLSLVILQIIPLPRHFVTLLSPHRGLPTAVAGLTGVAAKWTTLSIYPHATVVALFKLLAYCGAFILAAVAYETQRRRSRLIRALIILGCAEAVYGLIQYLAGFQQIFTYVKRAYTSDATGTYINRNHFAGFLELVVPLLVAQIFYFQQSGASQGLQGTPQRGRSRSWEMRAQLVVYVFLVAVLLMAVFFSRSRMGILSVVFSLLLMGLWGQIKARGRGWRQLTVFILGVAAAYAIWIGVGPVLERYEALEQAGHLDTEGRVLIWKADLNQIRDFPVLGTGLGTFDIAYRRYQRDLTDFFVDHAHSDYLEFTSDLGLVGALSLFLPIFYLLIKMLRAFVTEPSRYRRSVLLGCAGSIFAMLIHTAADFNLQIPANALVFALILGIGYKVACVEPRMKSLRAGEFVAAGERPASPEATGASIPLA